jgi:flagellar hook-length control protein FliK
MEAEGKVFTAQTLDEPDQPTIQSAPTVVTEQQAQPTSEPRSAAPNPPTSTHHGEVAVVDAARAPEESVDQETNSKERKAPRGNTSESPLLKADAVEGAEELVGAIKETSSALSGPSSQAGAQPAGGEAMAADSRPSANPKVENSATSNAHLEPDPVPTVDRARFVQRVGRAFQKAHARDGLIQLRLSPPELGSMKISITAQEGVLSAKIEVETAAARNLLLGNLPALRDRLAEQEIRIEKFDVDVPRDGGQETDSSSAKDRQSRESKDGLSPSRHDSESSDLETTSSTQNIPPIDLVTEGGLDVRI